MPTDPYTELVGALPATIRLQRTDQTLEALLRAMARGWSIAELVTECRRDMGGVANPGGVALTRLRDAARRAPPRDTPGPGWAQPIPWCGHCDTPSTRWRELPDGRVTRCWDCWTRPPS